MQIRLSTLSTCSPEERRSLLSELVRAAVAPRTAAQAAAIDARIGEYERRCAMTSTEMQRRLASGEIGDTADTARWLMLLRVRDEPHE